MRNRMCSYFKSGSHLRKLGPGKQRQAGNTRSLIRPVVRLAATPAHNKYRGPKPELGQQRRRVLEQIGKSIVKREHDGTGRQISHAVPSVDQFGQADSGEPPLREGVHVFTEESRRH